MQRLAYHPLDCAAQRLRQQAAIHARFQRIVLRSAVRRQLADAFAIGLAEDHDAEMWRDAVDPIAGFDALAVGQEQLDQHGRRVVAALAGPLRFRGQVLEARSQVADPIERKCAACRVDQRLADNRWTGRVSVR